MKSSELRAKLLAIEQEHGDLEVNIMELAEPPYCPEFGYIPYSLRPESVKDIYPRPKAQGKDENGKMQFLKVLILGTKHNATI